MEESVRRELAPTETLRVGINLGNPVIAQRNPHGGEPMGVGPMLGRELAKQSGLPLQFVIYETAGLMADAVKRGEWDVAFLAVDPARATDIAFTDPYVLIEGAYMVPEGSMIADIAQVDRDGIRIAVGLKTAYDLYLSREIKHATLVRSDSSKAAIAQFLAEKLEVVAGVRQPLVTAASEHPGHRVLPQAFMTIRQASGVPVGRPRARDFLERVLAEAKRDGLVRTALADSGQGDVTVAP